MDLWIQCLCIINIISVILCTGNHTLKLVQILFRHGDRTPTSIYKNDPYKYWSDGWGQLTNEGKQQMYTLGLHLRKHYEFLSPYYSPEAVYIKSSYADRCLMSAQLVSAGLFPPLDCQIWNPDLLWQPTPVHYLPRTMDALIAAKKPCPVYDTALYYAYKSARIKQLDKENKNLYEYLSKYSGENINNITAVETLYNTLEIERFHNLTLPEWTNNVSFDTMHLLASESLAIFTDSKLMQRLQAGPLLKDIVNNMVKKVNGSYFDLILYSGHDLTIVNLLRTLGFTNLFLPEYGAYLVFELHYIRNNYVVQVLYGKDFSSTAGILNFPFCNSPCVLADFINALQTVIPVDWDKECIQS